jgi:hypothetical protein
MDCPRCGGHVTVFELEEAVSRVCEDCSYVGVLVDHRPEDASLESWDDALDRFQTLFPDSIPDGTARVDDDTTPPDAPVAEDTSAGDGEFQFRGTPESTTVAGPGAGEEYADTADQSDATGAGTDSAADDTDGDSDADTGPGEETTGDAAESETSGDEDATDGSDETA